MIKTELCDLLGIKHPIIQAGMVPFSTNNLSVAAANAGALGVISSFEMGIGQMIWPSLIERLFMHARLLFNPFFLPLIITSQ